MTMTWDQVHVGDVLHGQDNQLWPVVGRTPGPRWAAGGHQDHFVMRLHDREVRATKHLDDRAPVARRADHSAMAGAWQALAEQGFRLSLIGESVSADEFSDPATTQRDDGIKFDRWKRYVLPHPDTGEEAHFTRVTTIASTLADTYGLNQWAKRNVARGMGLRTDLAAMAAAADPDTDKSTLAGIVEQAEAAAGAKRGANNGTAFHKFAERHDRGEPLESMAIPPAFAADVQGYAAALKSRSLRVVPDLMERIVYIAELGIVGTLDRVVSQPAGPTHSHPHAILDLKSGKDLSYSWMEIAIQQACYAHATHMWEKASKSWVEMPSVDMSRALIAHSPIGTGHTEIYGVDLIKGWTLAKASMQVRAWRKDTYSWLVAPDDPKAVVLHLISQAASREALAKLWEIHRDQFAEADVMAAAQQRLATLETVTQ